MATDDTKLINLTDLKRFKTKLYTDLNTVNIAYKNTANTFTSLQTFSGGIDATGGTLKINVINAKTTSSSTTYGPGTSGQVLKSNGTNVYWASDTDTWKSATSDFNSTNGIKIATGRVNGFFADSAYDLYAPIATATQAGVVSTGAQTFAGIKTFNDEVHFGGKATIYTSNEGGNFRIVAPSYDTTSGELDFESNVLRLYAIYGTEQTGLQADQYTELRLWSDKITMSRNLEITYTYSGGVSGLLIKSQSGAAYPYMRISCGETSNNKYTELGYDNANTSAYLSFKGGSSTEYTLTFPKKNGTIALTSDISATGCYPNINNNFTTGQTIHATDNTPLNLYANQYNSCCISFWYQSTLLSQFCSDINGNYYVYKPDGSPTNYFAMCNTANTFTQTQYIKRIQTTDAGGVVIAGGGSSGFEEGIRIPYASDGISTIILGCEADGSASGNAGFGMAMQRGNWNFYKYFGSAYEGAPTYFPDGGGTLYAMRTGSVIFTDSNTSPASMYGGTWESVGKYQNLAGTNMVFGWRRTA